MAAYLINNLKNPDADIETFKFSLDKMGQSGTLFDLEKLDYITSAGLRVVLAAQKAMSKQGSMKVRNVKPEIMKIFDMTGFTDWMNIE